jgi:hypothetical protein
VTLPAQSTEEDAVSPLELFFDLVFVFAVSQLSHHPLEHLTWRGAADGGTPSELDQPGLVRMQFQPELRHPTAKLDEEPLGVLAMLEPDDEVVGPPHDDHLTAGEPPPPPAEGTIAPTSSPMEAAKRTFRKLMAALTKRRRAARLATPSTPQTAEPPIPPATTGGPTHLLYDMVGTGPTAILNPLPTKLWRHTGLDLPTARVGPGAPGSHNAGLRFEIPLLLRMLPGMTGKWVPLPVLSLTPHALGQWARTLMLGDPDGCDALLIPPSGRLDEHADSDKPSADDLVDSFQRMASPAAMRLAVLCAPYKRVSLPLFHLMRQELVPAASLSDIAEVIVGGLFTIAGDGGPHLELHFREGVQARLQGMLSAPDAWRLFEALKNRVHAVLADQGLAKCGLVGFMRLVMPTSGSSRWRGGAARHGATRASDLTDRPRRSQRQRALLRRRRSGSPDRAGRHRWVRTAQRPRRPPRLVSQSHRGQG